jgi:hypothetical protein
MEENLSPLERNVGKSNTDFKETEGPANLHHSLAGLRGSFALLSEVGKNPGSKLSEFEEGRRHAGQLVASAILVALCTSALTASRNGHWVIDGMKGEGLLPAHHREERRRR